MSIFLVRHAKAGDRDRWRGPDDERPLTKPGRRQAEALVDSLGGADVRRVLSSPSLRCVETVEPIATARGLNVERDDALAEGATTDDTLSVIEHAGDGAVLCTHGDVMENVIGALAKQRVRGADPSLMKKGSIWVLDRHDRVVTNATYLPPPE